MTDCDGLVDLVLGGPVIHWTWWVFNCALPGVLADHGPLKAVTAWVDGRLGQCWEIVRHHRK